MSSLVSALAAVLPDLADVELVPSNVFADISKEPYFDLREATLLLSYDAISKIYQEATEKLASSDLDSHYSSISLLLLINGENASLWAALRRSFSPARLPSDLVLSRLVLKLHRKASCAWDYRLFLMSQGGFAHPREIELIGEIVERESQHYHAWTYRLLVMRRYLGQREREEEWARGWQFCEAHIRDSSAWHYIGTLAVDLQQETQAVERLKALLEVYYASEGLYPAHISFGLESMVHLLLRMHCSARWIADFLGRAQRPLPPSLVAAIKQTSADFYPCGRQSRVPSTP